MKYLTAKEAATNWGITSRRVQILCSEGRVSGAWRLGSAWAIPADAQKPMDERICRKEHPQSGKENTNALD